MLDMARISLDPSGPYEVAMVLRHHGAERWDPAGLGPCTLSGFPADHSTFFLQVWEIFTR